MQELASDEDTDVEEDAPGDIHSNLLLPHGFENYPGGAGMKAAMWIDLSVDVESPDKWVSALVAQLNTFLDSIPKDLSDPFYQHVETPAELLRDLTRKNIFRQRQST